MAAKRRRRRKRRDEGYRAPPQRGQGLQGAGAADAGPVPAARRRPNPERPPSPWGSFPLVELVVLLAIVLLVVGFVVQGTRGITMIAAGVVLGSLAGLELSVREHFAGYRSHTTVLAGAAAVLVLAAGFFLLPNGWPRLVGLAAAAAVFAAAFYLLREAFKRRSGGLGFR